MDKCIDKLPPQYDLDLPDAPDFASTPPVLTLAEMIRQCEKLLPFWNAKRFNEPPKEIKVEEFVLFDMEKP